MALCNTPHPILTVLYPFMHKLASRAKDLGMASNGRIGLVQVTHVPVNTFEDYGLTWGLQLGGGFSYMVALAVGLLIGNIFKGFQGGKQCLAQQWHQVHPWQYPACT